MTIFVKIGKCQGPRNSTFIFLQNAYFFDKNVERFRFLLS